MPKIDGKTRVYALLGSPVRHTMSPYMYNPLFEQLGYNAVYVAFEVEAGELPDAIAGIRALGLVGLHLTCPHKEAVIPLLDRLSREARAIGAVNVVLNNKGVLYGDNTDGRGYLRSLQRELDFEAEGKTIAILGAGGSARAVAFTLARVGAKHFYVFNRTHSRAERLVESFAEYHPEIPCDAHPLDPELFAELSPRFDLVINATTPGPDNPVDFLPVDRLPSHCICSDLNYFRPTLPMLERAAAAGLVTHDGLGMLVNQGALSMMLLAGISVKGEQLAAFIRERLGERRRAERLHS